MLKADPNILQCGVRRLAQNVSRKCVCREAVGLMGVVGGHLIFELNRVMRISLILDSEIEWVSDGEGPERRYYKVFIRCSAGLGTNG